VYVATLMSIVGWVLHCPSIASTFLAVPITAVVVIVFPRLPTFPGIRAVVAPLSRTVQVRTSGDRYAA
jgi:hypothetical protein